MSGPRFPNTAAEAMDELNEWYFTESSVSLCSLADDDERLRFCFEPTAPGAETKYFYVLIDGQSEEATAMARKSAHVPEPYNSVVQFAVIKSIRISPPSRLFHL